LLRLFLFLVAAHLSFGHGVLQGLSMDELYAINVNAI
jgi:hypothetical protein